MQPIINLKSFLAVLLLLIVPAALLVAYFRNYSTEGGGHEHGEKAKSSGAAMSTSEMSARKPGGEGHAAMGHDSMAKGSDKGAMKPGGGSNAGMGHGTMVMPQGGQAQPPPQQPAETPKMPAAQPPQRDGGHAATGHANVAQPPAAQSPPPPAQTTPQPGLAAATSARSLRSSRSMSSMGAGAELSAMPVMGSVKNLAGSGKGTEVVARLFHAGAADFFLDHAQHLTLSPEQQKKLNQIKERALLDNASASRKVQEAEQQLWKTTSADQPDTEEIETKVRQAEKLRADQRIGFIRAVDQAARVLTEEQRLALPGGAEQKHEPGQPKKREENK